jgi:hypothetical protein
MLDAYLIGYDIFFEAYLGWFDTCLRHVLAHA